MQQQSPQLTRRCAWLSVALVAITWVVDAQVGRFELVSYDDPAYVNSQVKNGLTFNGVRWAFVGYHDSNWIPLVWLSLMLDTTLFGVSPGGYHIVNLALHTANVLLVFGLLSMATQNVWRSAFVAALFAVHPLHVESVAWVSERKDVLSVFFGLLSLLAYVRYARTQHTRFLVVAFVLFIGSLLSKQTFVTLPFLLLLLDFWPLGRLTSDSAPPSTAKLRQVAGAAHGRAPEEPAVGSAPAVGEAAILRGQCDLLPRCPPAAGFGRRF